MEETKEDSAARGAECFPKPGIFQTKTPRTNETSSKVAHEIKEVVIPVGDEETRIFFFSSQEHQKYIDDVSSARIIEIMREIEESNVEVQGEKRNKRARRKNCKITKTQKLIDVAQLFHKN